MKSYRNKFKEYRVFSPNKSFFQLGIVWLTITLIVITSAILIYGLTTTEDYTGCMSTKCYEVFLTAYTLPIGVLSLLIPFGAIYAAQHRSELTIKLIKTSEKQNNFSNYYKHLEEFKLFLEEKNILNCISNYRQLHLSFFPGIKSGDDQISNQIRTDLVSSFLIVYSKLKDLEDISRDISQSKETEQIKKEKILKAIIQAYSPIKRLRKEFQFNLNDQDSITEAGITEYINDINVYNYIASICQTANTLLEICKFSAEFNIHYVMVALSGLDKNNNIIKGIPTNRPIKINLPEITNNGERMILSQDKKAK
jgi:hypothetical protein